MKLIEKVDQDAQRHIEEMVEAWADYISDGPPENYLSRLYDPLIETAKTILPNILASSDADDMVSDALGTAARFECMKRHVLEIVRNKIEQIQQAKTKAERVMR